MAKNSKSKRKGKSKPEKTKQTPEKAEDSTMTTAIYWLVVIGVISVSLVFYTHFGSRAREQAELFNVKNQVCIQMGEDLDQIYRNYTVCMSLYNDEYKCNQTYDEVFCYYAQCPTEESVMAKSEPLCVCTFIKDGEKADFCIRQAW